MNCLRQTCTATTDNPVRDRWSEWEFPAPMQAEGVRNGWRCPRCTAQMQAIIGSHGIIRNEGTPP